MLLKVFSLFDVKSGAYTSPFFLHHVGEAVRACIDLARDMNTTVARHPADFALHEIGTFETSTGFLQPEQPISHGTVLSMMPQQPRMFDMTSDVLQQPVRLNGSGDPTSIGELA